MSIRLTLADHIPLKQGLRLFRLEVKTIIVVPLADHIPLKQGLRQGLATLAGRSLALADHIPLKQGLRL